MNIEILDPTHEADAVTFEYAPRLASLRDATIAFVSNGKKGTVPFFDALERDLHLRYEVGDIVRLTKSNYSAPVEPGLLDGAARWNALVAGIGD